MTKSNGTACVYILFRALSFLVLMLSFSAASQEKKEIEVHGERITEEDLKGATKVGSFTPEEFFRLMQESSNECEGHTLQVRYVVDSGHFESAEDRMKISGLISNARRSARTDGVLCLQVSAECADKPKLDRLNSSLIGKSKLRRVLWVPDAGIDQLPECKK